MTAKVKWKLENQRDRLHRRIQTLSREHRLIKRQIKAIDLLTQ